MARIIIIALMCESIIALFGVLGGKNVGIQKYSAVVYVAAVLGVLALCLL